MYNLYCVFIYFFVFIQYLFKYSIYIAHYSQINMLYAHTDNNTQCRNSKKQIDYSYMNNILYKIIGTI